VNSSRITMLRFFRGRQESTVTNSRCRYISLLLLVLIFLLSASAQAAPPRRVIIDTDPGVDDAMAILLALNSPELQVEALTVVAGNVEQPQGSKTR
jgi:hypothetical protein